MVSITKKIEKTGDKMIRAAISGILTGSMILGSAYVLPAYAEKVEQEKFIAQELQCLALNIYFETRAVSMADAMAVSDVVQNRVESHRYPDTVCDVIYDGGETKRHKCQFSWYCDGKADTPKNSEAWERSRKFARDFYVHGMYRGITEGSTHYHASYVKPYWAPTLDRVTRIGSHIFYRRK